MELAILNLCVNARDAMPDGGVITIAAENVRIEGDDVAPGDFVKISVSDTGHRHAARSAGAGVRAVLHHQGRQQGSGLGLPQVYGFAQQSGGRVTIESAVGVGTTVTLLLPRDLLPPVAATAEGDPRRVGRSVWLGCTRKDWLRVGEWSPVRLSSRCGAFEQRPPELADAVPFKRRRSTSRAPTGTAMPVPTTAIRWLLIRTDDFGIARSPSDTSRNRSSVTASC